MRTRSITLSAFSLMAAAMMTVGCQTAPATDAEETTTEQTTQAMYEEAVVKPDSKAGGFVVFNDVDGHKWVFTESDKELKDFMMGKELAKHTTRITGKGTLKGVSTETLMAYQAMKPGFATRVVDGYLWIFEDGSEELAVIDGGGELAKHVTRVTADGTLKAPDGDVIVGYMAAKPGFVAMQHDGYLWVFYDNAEELDIIKSGGELAKHVTKVTSSGVVKAADGETIKAYMAATDSITTRMHDGYLWVFDPASEEFAKFNAGSELAKHVTKVVVKDGQVVTIKAPDMETIDAYAG